MRYFMQSFIVIMCVVGLISCGAPQQPAPTPIKIGVITTLTGEYNGNGEATRQSIDLAVKEVMAEGGLLVGNERRPIEIIYADDKNKPEVAVEVALKLINQDRVIGLIGAPFSSIAIPVGGVAENAKIPFISSTSTNPKTTQGRSYVFRACYTDPFQGEVLANFANDSLKLNKAAILYEQTSEYSQGLTEFFRQQFIKLGGTIMANEPYNAGETNWSKQIAQIKQMNPDFIFLPNAYLDVVSQTLQLRQAGLNQPLLGGDSWDVDFNIKYPEFENSYVSLGWHRDVADDKAKAFITTFSQMYADDVPSELEANTYDALNLLLYAITSAKSTESKAIRDALAATKNYHGVTGFISFNGSGDPTKSAIIVKITDGTSVYYQQVSPQE